MSDQTSKPIHCNQCEAARINGAFCHEIGCPNSKVELGEPCECCMEALEAGV